jgi:NADPH:quinone reductase-like Zn-dependent oxidoreductase
VLCGGAAGAPSIDFGKTMLERFHNSLSFTCFSLNSVEPEAWRQTMAEIFRLTVEKRIKALVDGELNLSQAAEAHRRMEAGVVFGKLVLVP